MKLSNVQFVTAFGLSLLVSVLGSAIEARAPFGLSAGYTQCSTKQASTSTKPVPTQSTTVSKTVTLVAVIVIQPVKTVTPTKTATITKPVVAMTTTTTTVAGIISTLTITAVTTSTTTVTAPTSTSTVTSTATTTATVPGDPVVVPTRDGFIPIISTLPGAMVNKREAVRPRSLQARSGKDLGSRALPKYYPKSVSCQVVKIVYKIIVVFKTGTVTRTVTAPTATSTVFSTSTATITSTVVQQPAPTTTTVTTTIVSSSTTTPVTTTTTTTTVTATVSLPASTSYAACDSNNLVGSVNGLNIVNEASRSGDEPIAPTFQVAAEPYDCCVACITDPSCVVSVSAAGACEIFETSSPDQCTYEGEYRFQVTVSSAPDGAHHIDSNGNCGFYDDAVADE